MRAAERKRLMKEELDQQIAKKKEKKQVQIQEDRQYDAMQDAHLKLLDQKEKEKQK